MAMDLHKLQFEYTIVASVLIDVVMCLTLTNVYFFKPISKTKNRTYNINKNHKYKLVAINFYLLWFLSCTVSY